jgi:uncharacterized membrane protein
MTPLKRASLTLMSLFYIWAGIWHFVHPEMYARIIPPYLPAPLALVYISGLAELLLGALLLPSVTRPWAARGLIALLLAVFPANIYMYQLGPVSTGWPGWLLLARLPLQGVLIYWAYSHTRDTPPARC